MNALRLIIMTSFVMFITHSFAAQNVDNDSNYKLVWQDTFDVTQLDESSKWTIVKDGKGGGNNELQYYRSQNIKIGKEPATGESCLVITAKKEKYRSRKFTSGRLSTQNKMSFKYGKVEARIKSPKTANGLWPAFWMLGIDYPKKAVWPKCGEIDIMEMGNRTGINEGTQDRYFNGACHWGENYNNGRYPNYGKSTINSYSLQEDFHLYTLIWDKTAIKMYLDLDKNPLACPYFEMPINGEDAKDKPARYFHSPFFILFNLAVGGHFPDIKSIHEVTALDNGDANMYVDFVKVYQKGDIGEKISYHDNIINTTKK